MTDETIREQTYRYFLQEAPELLHALEQELLDLRENYSVNKVHHLMRTTHTLKGAAASVGLETIKTVAHSLEDVFKALFNPDLLIDAEIEALLFEGYECLRLALTAQVTGGKVNDAEILDRTATVFAQLQEKLGDCFNTEAHIPSSVELGFDVTQSIFEVGVAQRLEEIAAATQSANPDTMATTLRSQCEVFQGLAQSLNLPGFGAIANAAIAALDSHPEQATIITETALADLQAAQAAVLSGDRQVGGQPSLVLQQLAGFTQEEETPTTVGGVEEWAVTTEETVPQLLSENIEQTIPPSSSSEESAIQPELDWVTSISGSDKDEDEEQDEDEDEDEDDEAINSILETIWGDTEVVASADEEMEDSEEQESTELEPILQTTPVTQQDQQQPLTSPSTSVTSIGSVTRTVRVNIEHLEELNYSIGELLTNYSRQSLQNDQLKGAVRTLLARLQHHNQQLGQLQDWSDRQFVWVEHQRVESWGLKTEDWTLRGQGRQGGQGRIFSPSPSLPLPPSPAPPFPFSEPSDRFDSLELDRYTEAQVLVQSILEDAVQLAEAAEEIELFTKQSYQTLEKQRRLLTSTRDSLMEARMLPVGEIFSRFPRLLRQLETKHNKQIVLNLQGKDVLVDKVVAEKLYDPLLHLVRNAFDHGIEPIEVRQQRGKSEKGQISLGASHQGRHLVIAVRDDGQGLDFEKIRQRAAEFLFSSQRANALSEQELTNLLFEPGFSTASQVNDLSGRGVGLDVVRAQMQVLQGSVAVHSEAGKGTTFTLQIPLNLSIAKLLLCQANDGVYAMLTDAIESIVIPQSDQIRSWEEGKVLRWGTGTDERLIPIHPLVHTLDYFTTLPTPLSFPSKPSFVRKGQMMPVILIRCQDRVVGLEVDQLIGEQELVIRPLGATIVPPDYVYGSSILADGRLTLVLDGAALIQDVLDRQVNSSTESDWASSAPQLPSPHLQQRLLPAQSQPALPGRKQTGEDAERRLAPDARTHKGTDALNIPAHLSASGLTRRSLPPEKVLDSPKFVLLVDDSITLRQALTLTLQKAGYQVLQAKDGYEAIEQLQKQPNIQLVICDIEMPRMNGFEFLKYRQQDPACANVPVVILSSRSSDKHRLIAAELGATDYITKPFLEHKLLAMVNDVIEPESQLQHQ